MDSSFLFIGEPITFTPPVYLSKKCFTISRDTFFVFIKLYAIIRFVSNSSSFFRLFSHSTKLSSVERIEPSESSSIFRSEERRVGKECRCKMEPDTRQKKEVKIQ